MATLKWSLASQIEDAAGICIIKVSICLSVLRVVDKAAKRMSIFLWILIAFIIPSHFVQVGIFLAECRPLAALWDQALHGTCLNTRQLHLAAYISIGEPCRRPTFLGRRLRIVSGLDAFTDLVCSILPVYIICRLQMKRSIKISLCCLMGLEIL